MEDKEQLEILIQLIYSEIDKYDKVIDAKQQFNVFRMRDRYNILQNEYFERYNKFYEVKK